jgi:hypothetical protein
VTYSLRRDLMGLMALGVTQKQPRGNRETRPCAKRSGGILRVENPRTEHWRRSISIFDLLL